MSWSWRIATIAGIPINVHGTFAVLIIFLLASGLASGQLLLVIGPVDVSNRVVEECLDRVGGNVLHFRFHLAVVVNGPILDLYTVQAGDVIVGFGPVFLAYGLPGMWLDMKKERPLSIHVHDGVAE